jgi:hypothetical protein
MSICSPASTEARICPMSAHSAPTAWIRSFTTSATIAVADAAAANPTRQGMAPRALVAKRPPSRSPAAVLFDVTEISAFSRQIKDIAPEAVRSRSTRHSSQRAIEALKYHARELGLSPRGLTIGSLRYPSVIALGVLQRSFAVGRGNHRALRRRFGRRGNQGLACWGRDVVLQCCGLDGGPVGDQRWGLRYGRGFDGKARDRARCAAAIGCQILTQGTGFVADPIGLAL